MNSAEALESRLKGLRYARVASAAFGAFLVSWGVFGMERWEGYGYEAAVYGQAVFFILYGAILMLPWKRIGQTGVWKMLFALLVILCVLFGFVMVTEVMALNYIATAAGLKAKPPVFQGILLFLALGQVPILLFYRKPELLD